MSDRPRRPPADKFIPLSPAVFDILLALCDEERHGYGIMQEVERRSGGQVRLRAGTLYRALARLVDERLAEESDERPAPDLDDERRRYYRLTDLGRQVVAAEARRLAGLLRTARAKKALRGAEPA
jgi:DNA-binding PadR family transcriptional regulator